MAVAMRPYYHRSSGLGAHYWPYQCEFHSSDAWVLVDAVVTIIAAVVTIAVLLIRHPFSVLATAILAEVVGALMGWW
jgi:hypothetical protein